MSGASRREAPTGSVPVVPRFGCGTWCYLLLPPAGSAAPPASAARTCSRRRLSVFGLGIGGAGSHCIKLPCRNKFHRNVKIRRRSVVWARGLLAFGELRYL